MNNRQRLAAGSAITLASVLVVVAIGYPDWLWFPLTIAFCLATFTLLVTTALEIRARIAQPRFR